MDVSTTEAYTATALSINPGLNSMFPWLSNLANNYEFYHFRSLTFEYEPACGTATAGTVMVAVDFDAADSVPPTKARLMSYMGAGVSAPYQKLRVPCSQANLSKMGVTKFTRPGPVPAGKDVKTYDVGNLIVASANGNTAGVGMIFADYIVELSTPHSPESFPWEDSAKISMLSAKATPLAGAVFTNADQADPVLVAGSNTSFVLRKPGEYLIDFIGLGTNLIPDLLTNILVPAIAGSATLSLPTVNRTSNETLTQFSGQGFITTALSDIVINMVLPAAWASYTSGYLRISPYKASML